MKSIEQVAQYQAKKIAARKREPKPKQERVRIVHLDATPERLAKGDYSEWIDPRQIDDNEQRNGTTARRFRDSYLDRLHRNGKLTWVQWYAGDWYRRCHESAFRHPKVTANYGDSNGGGECDYGLPVTENQLRAREKLRAARTEWPKGMQGVMDRMLIHDAMPRYAGRKAMRAISDIRRALDAMAYHLRLDR